MKQLSVLLSFSLFTFISCKKDTASPFHGLYTESSPIAGRSQLNFISENRLVKTETGSSYKDIFNYSFSTDGSKIILTPTWTNQDSGQEFDFKKIDESSFQIENLYPSIPEAPESFMVYKK